MAIPPPLLATTMDDIAAYGAEMLEQIDDGPMTPAEEDDSEAYAERQRLRREAQERGEPLPFYPLPG